MLNKLESAQAVAEDMVSEMNDQKDKAWLLHTALFIGFPYKTSFFLEICSHNKFSNTVEIACPHLVRYLISSSLLKKNGKTLEIVFRFQNALKLDDSLLSFTQYFEYYDVENALSSLDKFAQVIKEDFFLNTLEKNLIREAKKLLVFCHLKLNKQVESAWIEKVLDQDVGKAIQELSEEYKIHFEHQGKFVVRNRN